MGHAGEYQSHLETAEPVYRCICQFLVIAAFPGFIFKATGISSLYANRIITLGQLYGKP